MNIISMIMPKMQVAYIYSDNTIRQGLEKFRAHGYTAIPVLTRDNTYYGTVTEGDFLRCFIDSGDVGIKDMEKKLISDIVRPGFNPCVHVDITMNALFERSINQSFIPVVDDREYFVGIVTRQKIIRYFIDEYNKVNNGAHKNG